MTIAMIMLSLTALKKPNLIYIYIYVQHSLQGHSKGIHFFIFNLKTSRLSSCLSSSGSKSRIFGPRKDSNSVVKNELGIFQKYYSYKDYMSLFWAQIFLLENLETSL